MTIVVYDSGVCEGVFILHAYSLSSRLRCKLTKTKVSLFYNVIKGYLM